MSRNKNVASFATVTALLPCLAAGRDPAVVLSLPPETSAHLGTDRLMQVLVRAECMRISGITGLPEGWAAIVTPQGEDYLAELRPTQPDTIATPEILSSVRVSFSFRGKYSDCLRIRVTIGGGADRPRSATYESNFPRRGWKIEVAP